MTNKLMGKSIIFNRRMQSTCADLTSQGYKKQWKEVPCRETTGNVIGIRHLKNGIIYYAPDPYRS